MQKPFDQWNGLKKKLDSKPADNIVFFYERDVWWCSVGVNVGVESDGKNTHFERPVLILKKFNKYMLWVVPLTSKKRSGTYFYPINHDRGTSFACLSQLKSISSKRLLRKIGMARQADYNEAIIRIADYLNIGPRPSGALGGRSP